MTVKALAFSLFIFPLFGWAQNFKQHIVFLSSDSLHGRAPLTVDETKAAEYIRTEFIAAKCTSVLFQKLPFKTDSAVNVIGIIDNKKDSTIIISAHYDGLGYGGDKSREILKKGIHNGADDNASGVALMIELAKSMTQLTEDINSIKNANDKIPLYNFLFAAYSAHEAGLFGSDYFSKSKLCDTLKIRAVINFDMVGRLDKSSKTLRISGAETDTHFHKYFLSVQDSILHFRFDDTNIMLSDLKPFAEKGLPVLSFTTGTHNDYHKATDDESKINYEGMKVIFELIQKFFKSFAA